MVRGRSSRAAWAPRLVLLLVLGSISLSLSAPVPGASRGTTGERGAASAGRECCGGGESAVGRVVCRRSSPKRNKF